MSDRRIDLSHVIEHGMVTYRGIPAPYVCDFMSREASRAHYAPGTTFHIGRIDMAANTGTYLWLRDRGASLVGIDSLNIDDTADGQRPVHTTLLRAGIPIVEHLRGLEQLPAAGFTFTAVPPPVKGMGTFPVRAYATIN